MIVLEGGICIEGLPAKERLGMDGGAQNLLLRSVEAPGRLRTHELPSLVYTLLAASGESSAPWPTDAQGTSEERGTCGLGSAGLQAAQASREALQHTFAGPRTRPKI